ncbi:MAG: hypothetical protein ACE5RK_01920 [Candidatus Nitrosomaritimum aestuariumsis]|nr:hypothetical protein [Nitrosopumilaceae archaeon]
MHCDDKRTIFALKKSLEEYSIEKERHLSELETETDFLKKSELKSKIDIIEKTTSEIKHQLTTM